MRILRKIDERVDGINKFLVSVDKYTDLEELTAEGKRNTKYKGIREIKIIYKFVGDEEFFKEYVVAFNFLELLPKAKHPFEGGEQDQTQICVVDVDFQRRYRAG